MLGAAALAAVACGDGGAITTATTTTTITTTTTTTLSATTTAAPTTTVAPTTTEAPTTTIAPTTTSAAPTSRCEGLASMTVPDVGASLIRIPGSFDGDPQPESIMETDGAILFPHDGSWWFGFSLHSPYVVFIELP